MECPFCGAENAENADICTYCVSGLPQKFEGVQIKYCHFCGNKIPENAVVCVNCGNQIEEPKSQAADPLPLQRSETPQVIIGKNDRTYNNDGTHNNYRLNSGFCQIKIQK